MVHLLSAYQLHSLEPSDCTVCAGLLEPDPGAEAAAASMGTELCVAGLFLGVCRSCLKGFKNSALCSFTWALGIIAAFLHEEQALR